MDVVANVWKKWSVGSTNGFGYLTCWINYHGFELKHGGCCLDDSISVNIVG